MSANLSTATREANHLLHTPVGDFLRTKGVYRHDNARTFSHGFVVQMRLPGGGRVCKLFSDRSHGGPQSSFTAALQYRDELLRAHNMPPTERYRAAQRPVRSPTGVNGVQRTVSKGGHVVYAVCWNPEPMQTRTRKFYAPNGDERAAFARAVQFRKARERAQWWDVDGGRSLAAMTRAAIPDHIRGDLRDDAAQELALAILDGRDDPDTLNAQTVRPFVSLAWKFNPRRRGKLVSLDARVVEGSRLRLVDTYEG